MGTASNGSYMRKVYAQRFDVLFNSKKSQVIIYKPYNVKPPDPCVTINDARVKCVDNVIRLGHLLTENVYEFNMSKCIDNFNHQYNIFLADFKYCSSHIRNVSFQRYCISFWELKYFLILIQIYKMCILHKIH